jgi:uncharacterized protein (DUF1800 family)
MRLKLRFLALFALVSTLLGPVISITHAARGLQAGQQQGRPFEALVAAARSALSLDEKQVEELKKILAARGPKIVELRNLARSQPYAPQVLAGVQREQREIKEELSAHLSDDQKSKLGGFELRLPVPLPPPFVAVHLAPRAAPRHAGPAPAEPVAPPALATGRNSAARLTEDQRILHLLNRAGYGPRPGDIERVRKMGIERFLDEQLSPETIDNSEVEARLSALPTLRMTSAELYQFYPPPQVIEQRAKERNPAPVFGRPQQPLVELIQHKLSRAVSSNRQLQEVMADFWFNHFNVFAQKEADLWMVTSYERDVIRPRAIGRFRDLLLAIAESPAMLYYLDNWLSTAPGAVRPRPASPRPPRPQPAPGAGPAPTGEMTPEAMTNQQPAPQNPPPARPPRGINENYARELLELHTLGVDGGYTQKDVQEVARCFTGWTIDRPFQGGGFVFRPWMHDSASKRVLGFNIPAGGGIEDGKRVIEILARHPSTARLISKRLCKRFVSDEPPSKLVERIAQVYMKTDGDIREALRAIFTSPEFNSAASFRSKVKSPLELAASAIRALDGDTNGAPALHEWVRKMGQPLYLNQSPAGYSEDSGAWVNTGVFFNRLNFAVALSNNQIAGTRYEPSRLVAAESVSNEEQALARLTALITHTQLSTVSRQAVLASLADRSKPDRPAVMYAGDASRLDPEAQRRVGQMIGLLMSTAEFQRK